MYPKLYSKNYLTENSVLEVTSGNSVKQYLYDQLKTPQWISSGETDEDGDHSCHITIYFMTDGYSPYSVNRTFDTLVLINTNLKKFKLQYWDGTQFVDIADTIKTTNTDTDVIIDFSSSPVASEVVRLVMDSTITPGEEKKIGELWVMDYKFILEHIIIGHDRDDWGKEGAYRLAGGQLETWNEEVDKFTLNQTLRNVGETLRDNLKDLKDDYDNFTIYPNGDEWVDDFFLVYWVNPWKESYLPKIDLYVVPFHIEEV